MDVSVAEPDTDRGTNRIRLVFLSLVVLLVAASAWAFTEDTAPFTNPPAVRVSPGDAYNPVAAGEALPDGFRQLLPRDAILPVYNPTFVPGNQIGWPAATDVIGIERGGVAKAYPVSFLNGRELVDDEIDGVSIVVTW
jgi:hypothetical protein